MTAPHPHWCDTTRCTAGGSSSGVHEGTPARITIRGKAAPPKLLALLWSPSAGSPVKIRLIVISELIVSTLDLTLDESHLAANTLLRLIEQAKPPEIHAGDGWPINGRG